MAPASNQKIIRSFEPGSSRGDLDLLELGKGRASLAIYDLRSKRDIETGVGEPRKGNSIKVRRSAAEADGRYAKIFVETANRFLSNQADRRIPVFPQAVAEFVVGTFVIGAIVSNRKDFEN